MGWMPASPFAALPESWRTLNTPGCPVTGRRDFAAQAYCAAYVLTQKYAVPAPPFQFDRITADLTGEAPQLQRQFLSDVKTTAYSVSRQLGRGLREPLDRRFRLTMNSQRRNRRHPRSRPDRLNADEPEVFRLFSISG